MSYSATPLQLSAHRDALIKLWSENLGDPLIRERAAERVRWLYERAPAGPAQTWLGVDDGSTSIIGCGSCYPRDTWVDGVKRRGAILADFAVDRLHRTAGPAVVVQRAIAGGSGGAGIELVYGWPNNKSLAVFKRIGYRVVGQTSIWMKPLRSHRHVRKRLGERPGADLAARLGAPVLDLALAAQDVARAARGIARLRSDVVSRADARFDELWTRSRPRWNIGEKSAAYLNWRYADFPTATYRFFTLSDRRTGRLEGYVAYTHRNDAAIVADLFCADLGSTVDDLLLRFARRAWREGAATVSLTYMGTRELTDRLAPLGFHERTTERSLVLYDDKKAPPELAASLTDPQRWFMIDGELDI
jgi:hypothetical protein